MDQPKKRSDSVRGRLSKLLGIEKETSSSDSSKTSKQIQEMKEESEKKILNDILKNLNKSQSPEIRLASVQECCNFLRTYRIDDPQTLRMCWRTIEDLFEQNKPTELQKTGFTILCSLLENQYENLEPFLRHEIFLVVKQSALDHIAKFNALFLLTDYGHELSPYEKELPDLLLNWLMTSKHTLPLLNITLYIVKHNTTLFDELSIVALLKKICSFCDETTDFDIIERCLKFCEVLTKKGRIPSTTLHTVISTLCKTVNIERFCLLSWQIMKELLSGETRGYQGIRVLCQLLDDPNNRSKIALLRGAVFFVSMSLWGFQKISTLKIAPSLVLPSFLKALLSGHPVVAYEVLLAIRRLVKKYGPDLRVEWDILFNIIFNLKPYTYTSQDQQNSITPLLFQLLEIIEDQYRSKQFFGDEKLLFQTLESFVSLRDEAAAFFILDRKVEEIIPTNSRWLYNLQKMMTVFFLGEKRTPIRAKAFAILKNVFETYKFLYGPEIAEKAVIPYLSNVHLDPDPQIRAVGIELLVHVAENVYTNQFFSIVDLLQNFITSVNVDADVRRKATSGLLTLFRAKFPLKRFTQTLYIYERLLPLISDSDSVIRCEVLKCLLQLRANDKYQMQLGEVTCLYLKCQPGNRPNIGYFMIAPLFEALIGRVKKEPEPEIFTSVVRGLYHFLTNKWILFQIDVKELLSLVCRLLEHKIFGMPVDCLPISENQKMENFQLGYELLTLLIGYVHEESTPLECLEEIASCFYSGLSHKWSCPLETKLLLLRTCLNGLCICNAEIPSGVTKFVPKIISTLHQISLTHPEMAMSILEYFNSLVTFPTLIRKSLNSSDFKTIFTTILHFSDTTKYPPIVATFAYQVLALWLLQCNIKERPQYFALIKNSLQTQIQQNKCLLAEANLDLLSRYTFTDCEAVSSSEDNNDDETYLFKGGKTQIWVQGNTLITIKTGRMGWVKVTVRRATGKFVWLMQLQNRIRSIGEKETRANYLKEYINQIHHLIERNVENSITLELTHDLNPNEIQRNVPTNLEQRQLMQTAVEQSITEKNSKVHEQSETKLENQHSTLFVSLSPVDKNLSKRFSSDTVDSFQQQNEVLAANSQILSSPILSSHVNALSTQSLSEPPFSEDFTLRQNLNPNPNSNLSGSWTSQNLTLEIQPPFSPPESLITSLDLTPCTNVSLSHFSPLPSYEGDEEISRKKSIPRRKLSDFQQETSQKSENVKEITSLQTPATNNQRLANTLQSPPPDQIGISSTPPMTTFSSKLDFHHSNERHFTSTSSLNCKQPFPIDAKSTGSSLHPKRTSLTNLTVPSDHNEDRSSSFTQHLSFASDSPLKNESVTSLHSLSLEIGDSEENLSAKYFTKLNVVKTEPNVDLLQHIMKKDLTESRRLPINLSQASNTMNSPSNKAQDTACHLSTVEHTLQRTSLETEDSKKSRNRGDTISPPQTQIETEEDIASKQLHESPSSIHPSFVFLQLQQIPFMEIKPKQLKIGEALDRALSVLDKALTVETHKIGVLFIDEGQTKQEEILSNTHGSPRYLKFIRNLGTTIHLKNLKAGEYTGGLDRNSTDQDGEFALRWCDDVTQVMFHVVTFMPNIPSDPHFTNKKRHIGNDYVHIVWSESNRPYDPDTITSQFTFVSIVIYPLEPKFYRVDIRRKVDIPPFGPITKSQIVTETSLSTLIRQTAIHANLASKLFLLQQKKIQYVSNCEDRLRQIKTIAERFAQESE